MLSDRATDALEGHFRADLMQELRFLSDQIDLERLAEAIAAGDLSAAEREAGVDSNGWALSAFAAFIGPIVRDIFEEAARDAADEIGIDYDLMDEDATLAQRDLQREMILVMGARARETVLGVTMRGARAGLSAVMIAGMIKGGLWIADRNAAAIDAMVARMRSEGLKERLVLTARARAILRALRIRARAIAASETTRILARASRYMWRLGIKLGALDPNVAEVEWETERDNRVCPVCEPLDGDVLTLREYLDSGFDAGEPPLHVLCRCRLRLWRNGKR